MQGPLAKWIMLWITQSEKDTAAAALERRLWYAAKQIRANFGLKSQEYSAQGWTSLALTPTTRAIPSSKKPLPPPHESPRRRTHFRATGQHFFSIITGLHRAGRKIV
jgi:hypothetical protein